MLVGKSVLDCCHFAKQFGTCQDALDDSCNEEGTVWAISSCLAHTGKLVCNWLLIDDPVFTIIPIILFNLISCSTKETFPNLLVDEMKHVNNANFSFASS